MKKIITLILVLFSITLNAQEDILNIDEIVIQYEQIKSKTNIDATDKSILDLFDNLFSESLQSDGISISEETISNYKNFNDNQNISNWHLFYLFACYQAFVSEATQNPRLRNDVLQLWYINTLSEETESIFGFVPVLIAIYQGEAYLSTGRKNLAIKHFLKYIEIYPNAIPIIVYNFQLEYNLDEKDRIFNNLKTNYSSHWMVKEKVLK